MSSTLAAGCDSSSASHDLSERRLLDLPQETISIIFDQFEDHELAGLMGVSHAFRDLAATRLYRSINYTVSDDENGALVDPLVDMLETLATSEYGYATFVKEIYVTSAALSERSERLCRDRFSISSCGKLLNLTLHMVLKRTTVLETFIWDLRVELSPPVLSKLSTISSLQHLSVRLHPGQSMYSRLWMSYGITNPPPTFPATYGGNQITADTPKNAPRRTIERRSKAAGSFAHFRNLASFGALDIDTLDYVPELAKCISASSKSLKHLALSFSESMTRKAKEAQTDTSDTEVTISDGDLSENGAHSAHLGSQEHSTETWQMAREAQEAALARILGLHLSSETKSKSTSIDRLVSQADREVLNAVRNSHRSEKDREFLKNIREISRMIPDLSAKRDAKSQKFADKLERAATKYLERSDFSAKEHGKVHDTTAMANTANKLSFKPLKAYQYPTYTSGPSSGLSHGAYFPASQSNDGMFLPTAGSSHSAHYSMAGPSSNTSSKYYATPSSIWVHPQHKYGTYGSGATQDHIFPESNHSINSRPKPKSKKSLTSESSSSSVFSGSSAQVKPPSSSELKAKPEGSSNPPLPKHENHEHKTIYDDDIDIDHPDDIGEVVEDQAFIENDDLREERHEEPERSNPTVSEEPSSTKESLSSLDSGLTVYKRKGKEVARDRSSSREGQAKLTSLPEHSSKAGASSSSTSKPETSAITEYLRLSHGLALESIALHRIPVKPSVLFRAIDMSRLKHLTLLDVGPQRAAWAMLSKLNKSSPLQLEVIHTNNVTHSLLVFLNGLEPSSLQELYLFEPSSRHRSTNTQKTSVTISEIRKQALKKHIQTLRILMIRNDSDMAWSLDRETTRLLCHAGKLRELVVAMNSETFHLLLRHFPKLAQLHALHIIYQPKSSNHLNPTQATNEPPNPVNMVVNQPPPIAMPHPPHAPSQYTSSTRMTSQARETILLELRAAIIDAVALCQQTELEWLGLSYDSADSRSDLRLARLFNWRSEKRPNYDSESEGLDAASSSGDSDVNGYMDDIIGLEDWIPMAEAEAQIWEKSVWTGKL
ncbi:MAG: hypothetical protein Q9160_002238 [Pyrenula sp. 1 TL-2023]